MTHRYAFPPTDAVIYGHRALEDMQGELARMGSRRALLVTTGSVRTAEIFDQVEEVLGDRCAAVFHESIQHLPTAMADHLIGLVRDVQPDAIVTLGGGTVSDAGKLASAAHAVGAHHITDLAHMRFEATSSGLGGGLGVIERDILPQIAIPTTLSAAEYCGAFAVTDGSIKHGYVDIRLTPRVVILDPRATEETPAWLWASTGMRALDHAVESYLSRAPTPPTDATAVAAALRLFEHLPESIDGPSMDARLECLVAGWLSMFGFHNAAVGLSHAIGHQLGARFNVPHGYTSCITLPVVLSLLGERVPSRTASFARQAGLAQWHIDDDSAARTLRDAVSELVECLPVPRRLRDLDLDLDVDPAVFDSLAEAVVSQTTARFAPFDVSTNDVRSLLHAAY